MPKDDIHLDLYQRAVHYSRDGRQTYADIAPIGRAQQHWRIKPETLKWWKEGKSMTPVTDAERRALVARIVELVRQRHDLKLETREWSAAEIAMADAAPDDPNLPAILSGGDPDPLPIKDPEAAGNSLDPNDPSYDPELAALDEYLNPPTPTPPSGSTAGAALGEPELLAEIDAVLRRLGAGEAQGWDPAVSICRQLRWCRDVLLGTPVEKAPGPFSMGLIATREFDMYGSDPDLARQINRIQDAMQGVLGK